MDRRFSNAVTNSPLPILFSPPRLPTKPIGYHPAANGCMRSSRSPPFAREMSQPVATGARSMAGMGQSRSGATSITWSAARPGTKTPHVIARPPKETSMVSRAYLLQQAEILIALCREPPLISGWLGDCGQWRRNFKQGRPSKRTNAGLPITRWRILSARFGWGLSRSH
jgi:hypothetical protein